MMYTIIATVVLISCSVSNGFSNELEEIVDLCGRNITEISGKMEILNDLNPDIESLNLCDNNLTKVDPNAFRRFKRLTRLVLDDNPSLAFPSNGSSFLQHESLNELQCVFCGVDKIYSKSLQGLPKLDTINLTNNRIIQISAEAFRGNHNLTQIDIKHNNLSQVPTEMLAGLNSMNYLDLSSNTMLAPVEDVPFLDSESLSVLKCNKCGFNVIYKATFSRLPSLGELHLIENRISKIDNLAFASQTKLYKVMLQYNYLQTINFNLPEQLKQLCLIGNTNQLECFIDGKFAQSVDTECINSSTAGVLEPLDVTTKVSEIDCLDTTIITAEPEKKTMEVTTESNTVTSTPAGMTMIILEGSSLLTSPQRTREIAAAEVVTGISDAYISGYLTLIILTEIGAFVLLTGVWLKLKKYDSDPDVDRYSESILNPNPIYGAIR